MSLEEELRKETLKWLGRIEDVIVNVRGDEEFLENVRAYVSDSEYFLKRGDLIRAFECVVWAWAWLEIGEMVGKIERRRED